jgi:hypothetical protein
LNLQIVDGGNENERGRQCGDPIALIGHKSTKGARWGADKAFNGTRLNGDEGVRLLARQRFTRVRRISALRRCPN